MQYLIFYENGTHVADGVKLCDSLEEFLEIRKRYFDEHRDLKFYTIGRVACYKCDRSFVKYESVEHPSKDDYIGGGSNGIMWKINNPPICSECFAKQCKHKKTCVESNAVEFNEDGNSYHPIRCLSCHEQVGREIIK